MAIERLTALGHQACLTPQNIVEFWSGSTRPISSRGFGLSPTQAGIQVSNLESIFIVLPEDHRIYTTWRSIVLEQGISGKQVHDARLAAALRIRQIPVLLTENYSDFKRFHWLDAITPEAFLRQGT